MKTIVAVICLIAFASKGETHAVLNAERNLIVGYEEISAGLVDSYRFGGKPEKVAQYRLLVVPQKPDATLQQTVQPAGTNINDGGFTLTPTNVTKVWTLRALTPGEITGINSDTASTVSQELTSRMRAGNWEDGFLRMTALMAKGEYFLLTALARGNALTNLTAGERNILNQTSNEIRQIYDLWKNGETNYLFVKTNSIVVTAPTNWLSITIEE